MSRIILILFLVVASITGRAQSFTDFVHYLNQLPIQSRQSKADSFFAANPVLPYIEMDTVCRFLFKGQATTVSIAGDMTQWQPGKIVMTRIAGTDLWFGTFYFNPDARIDYKIVADSNWILDPLNPYTCRSGFGVNSELRMPQYRQAPESVYNSAVPQGIVRDTLFASSVLGNSRLIRVYLPAGWNKSAGPYPVVLFHDGIEYTTLANATVILDNLISEQRTRPVIAVFIAPADRNPEYSGDSRDKYGSFIVKELMPVLGLKYHISNDPHDRATAGISNGGNAALYLGCRHPESFGKIAAFSSNVIPEVTKAFSKDKKMDLEVYIDIGRYDIDALIPMAENLVSILKEKGYTYRYYTWNDGHSWANWRDHLGIALEQFFPASMDQTPVKFKIKIP